MIQPGDAAEEEEELETLNETSSASAPAVKEALDHPAAAQQGSGAQAVVALAADHGLVRKAGVEADWGTASEVAQSTSEDDVATFAQGIAARYVEVAFAAETLDKAGRVAPTSELPEQAIEGSATHLMVSRAWAHRLVSVKDRMQSARTTLVGPGEMRQEDLAAIAVAAQVYLVAQKTPAASSEEGGQARQVVEQAVEVEWGPELGGWGTAVVAAKPSSSAGHSEWAQPVSDERPSH